MNELMHAHPEITWLILAATSCMAFLAIIGIAEAIIFPRKRCKRDRDM